MTGNINIPALVKSQRDFFKTGTTLSVKWRKEQLHKLLAAVCKYEKPLMDALWKDLHKSEPESYLCETSIVKGEIRSAIKHLERWAKPKRVKTPITHFPASSRIIYEPLGTALIIAPWNYPVNLLLNPLVGAIGAGCTAVLKPSPYVPIVSSVLEQMIEETFPKEYIAIVQGHRDTNAALLAQRWDFIFFTGSPALGRVVAAAAAPNLTPMVLELGGKSPCIVGPDANLRIAARRIAWGKTLNAGQTCIAPDYLLLHKDIKDAFVAEFKKAVEALHGTDARQSQHYVRLVTDKAYQRVKSYLKEGKVLAGGAFNDAERYIEPTLLDNVSPDSNVMTTEIFGPIFPVLTYESIDEVLEFVNSREKPLAFYYFGKVQEGYYLLEHTSSGGACINDTIMHFANANMPFGGVGNSGQGHYHEKETFLAFSHTRSVLNTSSRIDLPFRYMPYKTIALMKKILR